MHAAGPAAMMCHTFCISFAHVSSAKRVIPLIWAGSFASKWEFTVNEDAARPKLGTEDATKTTTKVRKACFTAVR